MRQAISIDGHDLDATEVVAVSKVYTKAPLALFKETNWEVYFTIYFRGSNITLQVHRSDVAEDDVPPAVNKINELRKALMDKL